ncbi:Chitin synthase, class 7 [Basidiobolus ranarum]|uniref:Chitin synthase export chaperone n=1 Tax=Basidiobolus ranarum TaxID=34480 RepID=A0ABR2W705_9FUNG
MLTTLKFGSFDQFCGTLAYTLCPLVGPQAYRTIPECASRNLDLGGFLVFQPGALAAYIIAILVTVVMIYNIRVKYTAVGRQEMLCFFYLYTLTVILELLLIGGFIPISSEVYSWFTAAHIGLISASIWCLLLNGFVGFQFAEDGTPLSLWSIRISSLLIWGATFFVSIATFRNMFGNSGVLSSGSPLILWIIYFIFNGAALLIYFILQIILVVNTLTDRWPLGDILMAGFSFVVGQVILLVFTTDVCTLISHYLDGLFFTVLCTLFAVMMIYKYWDSITKDDLEYTVDYKPDQWEVKGFLEDTEMDYYQDRY